MDQNLNIKITADSSAAVAATSESQASVDRLTAAIGELTAQFGTLSSSSEKGEASLTSAGTAAESAGAKIRGAGVNAVEAGVGFDTFTEHAYMLQRGMEAAGFSAEASAVKIGAMGEAMAGFAAAVPGVLLLVTALSGLAAAFSFVRDGVRDAQQTQNAMEELRIAVNQTGDAWESTKSKVDEWAQSLATLSGIAESETIPMLNYLVQNGQSVSGAMSEVTIAADAVAAGMVLVRGAGEGASTQMQEFKQVLRALQEAESGHYTMLERIDAQLTPLIEKHASLSDILEKLNADTEKAVSNNHSLAMEEARVHGEMSVMGETIGAALLPALANLERGVAVIVDAVSHMGQAFSDFGQGAVKSVEGVLTLIGGLAQAIFDFDSMNLKQVGHDVQEAVAGANTFGEGTKQALKGVAEGWSAASQGVNTYVKDFLHAKSEIASQSGAIGSIAPDSTSTTGGKGSKSSSIGGVSPTFPLYDSGSIKQQTDDYQVLAKSIDALPKSIAGYQSAVSALDLALQTAHAQQNADKDALDAANAAADLATQRYNAFAKELNTGVIPATKQNAAILKGLNDDRLKDNATLDQANQKYNQITRDVDTLTGSYGKNSKALHDSQTAWQNFVDKSNQGMQDDLATFKMTSEQKYSYYMEIVNRLEGAEGDLEKYREQMYAKALDAYKQGLQEQFQAEQQYEQQVQSHISSFINDIVVGHKSMASELKSIYGDIAKSFSDLIAQMIGKAVMAMPFIQAIFGGGGGGSMSAAGWTGAGVGVPASTSGGAFSPSSASGGAGGFSPSFARGGDGIKLNPFSAGGSSGGGYSSTSGAGYYPSNSSDLPPYATAPPTSGGGNGVFGLGNIASLGQSIPWGTDITGPGGTASLGSFGLAGAGGALIGQLAFGGRGFADLGGSIGAMAGLFFGGPIGAAVGAIVGSFAGSLFGGDHFNPADEPDIYQQDAWGQSNADMQGMTQANPMTANGKTYTMDSWTQQATNGKGWNVLMESFVNQFKGNQKALSPQLQGAFSELSNLWGGAQNQQYFNNDGKDGYLDIGSGERALWSKFWSFVEAYGPEVSTLMSNYSSMASYNSNLNGSVTSLGNYNPGGAPSLVGVMPNPIGGSAYSGGGAAPPGSPGNPGNGGGGTTTGGGGGGRGGGKNGDISVNIYNAIGGSMISQRNLEETIRAAVASSLPYGTADMQR